LHKKTTQNFICTWPEHLTIVSSWMPKSNATAVVVEKCEYHRTCCDYLAAAACQDGRAWNKRKKTTTFLSAGCKYGLRFVKNLSTHVQVHGVVAMGKDKQQGCNASYCWQQPLLFSVEL